LQEREEGRLFDVIQAQVKEVISHLNAQQMKQVVIAYEPVWAIGTGVTASNEQAQEMHAFIREELRKLFGSEVAEAVQILYGGSMNAANAADLLACADVDGGLIGGASLKPNDFLTIYNS
jgi:triosephosphate isomerase